MASIPIESIVGSPTACERYGISRSTLIRRIQAGAIVPLKKVDDHQYLFDVRQLPAKSEAA